MADDAFAAWCERIRRDTARLAPPPELVTRLLAAVPGEAHRRRSVATGICRIGRAAVALSLAAASITLAVSWRLDRAALPDPASLIDLAEPGL